LRAVEQRSDVDGPEVRVTNHWRQRVRERIGKVDPDLLAEGLIWAIRGERVDLVRFVARVSRKGARLFRFRVPDRRYFFALIDTETEDCITVMPPGFLVPREGKSSIVLRESDL
jgi:hypothetical protein